MLPVRILCAALAAALLAPADTPVADQSDKPKETKTSRKPRVRLAGFSVGAGYSHFSGP